MKNTKTNKNLFYILPIISLSCVIAIMMFTVAPKIAEIQSRRTNIQSLTEKKQKLEEKNKTLEQLSKNSIEQRAQLTALNIALPNQKEVPSLIIQLQTIAQESDVEIQSIQISPGILVTEKETPAVIAPELNLNIGIRGNYAAVTTFFDKIYKAKRLINIDTLNLSASGTETDGNVSVTLNLTTFYQPINAFKPTTTTEEIPKIGAAEKRIYEKLQTQYTSYGTDNTTTN